MYSFLENNFKFYYRDDPVVSGELSGRHVHNVCVLHFILKGKGQLQLDDASYEFNDYDLVFIPDHVYHYFKANSEYPYQRINVSFPRNYFDDVDLTALFDAPKLFNILSYNNFVKIFDLLGSAEKIIENENDRKAFIISLTKTLLYLLKNTKFDINVSKTVNELASKTVKYINDHIYEPITVEGIAKDLFICKSHLQNCFSKIMKIGVKEYIIIKKMNLAYSLINEGYSSTQAASMLGYTTYSCFYKSYIKVFGVSPRKSK